MGDVKFEVKKSTKDLLKFVISGFVGTSTSFCVRQAIRNNVDSETPKEQLQILVGSAAVGSAVARHTKEYTDKRVDSIFEIYESLRNFKKANDDTPEEPSTDQKEV